MHSLVVANNMPPLEIQPTSPELIDRSALLNVNQGGYIIEIPKLQANANRRVSECLSRYEHCYQRANKLACALWHIDLASSHTQTACRSAVLIGLPTMLRQSAALVENLPTENSDELQSSLALDLIERYLEDIEKAIIRDDIDLIDQKLGNLISTLGSEACSVSLGRASELMFNLGLAPIVYYDAKGSIQASVEALVEIRANDLLSDTTPFVRPYRVEIEYCKLRTIHFPSSSDRAGEAHIMIKLTPLGGIGEKKQDEWRRPLNFPRDEAYPIIQEARICQTNAVLSKQAISADMFTSCVFGENSLKIRLVVNTFRTELGEAPNLLVKLILKENRA